MSRFFGNASDSDTESEVSEEEVPLKTTTAPAFTVTYSRSYNFVQLYFFNFLSLNSVTMKKSKSVLYDQLKKRGSKN